MFFYLHLTGKKEHTVYLTDWIQEIDYTVTEYQLMIALALDPPHLSHPWRTSKSSWTLQRIVSPIDWWPENMTMIASPDVCLIYVIDLVTDGLIKDFWRIYLHCLYKLKKKIITKNWIYIMTVLLLFFVDICKSWLHSWQHFLCMLERAKFDRQNTWIIVRNI